MKEGLIKDTYELIIKEIQTILTVFYITIVGIGMLFKFQKFSEFDINIFNYADVFDFLIAPFSDFYILLFATVSILFVITIIKLDTLMKNKWPKFYSKVNFGRDKKSWYKTYRIVGFTITFILYLYISADYYGKYTKEKIINQNDITIKLADNELQSGKLIGQTKDIIFLLKSENVYAIPITSLVKEIKIN
ncbi:hypothetical protein [Olleya namhaensis]|uniref:hypothetical protein n=1 Tax=Olleya namhaensis TaxID=1144750 RepID=UPI00232CE2C0|nr:hypothetical protein [Olleya namhaensis]